MSDVPPPPDRLYTADDLYAGWDADDPMSTARTFDFVTYRTARTQGTRTPSTREVAEARAAHDVSVTWLLDEAIRDAQPVAIMGGHDLTRSSNEYAMIAELSLRLAGNGFTMLSGGGPGAMEATHLGARCAGDDLALDDALAMMRAGPPDTTDAFPFRRAEVLFDDATGDVVPAEIARLHAWQAPAFDVAARTAANPGASIGIPTWLYGHEPPTPLATSHAKYFENSVREDGLLAVATAGVVFAPGKAGTLQEIFQDAAQNYYTTVGDRFSPMVFLDIDGYWSTDYQVRAVLERLFTDDQELNLSWVTTPDEAVDVLTTQADKH